MRINDLLLSNEGTIREVYIRDKEESQMDNKYDLIVIGTGSAGAVAAKKCSEAGWSVAIIDDRPFGGTCAIRGCDPKKVLVGAAELMDWHERMQGNGLAGHAQIDWQALMAFKQTFTQPVPEQTEEKFKKLGIQMYTGKAVFQSETEIQVGSHLLVGEHILIATGAQPVKMGIQGEEHLASSDDFLELEELPRKIVFVGGGYISFEFAHIAARAGAEVHIIHRGDDPLKQFDQDLVQLLLKRSREIGIHLHLGVSVEEIEKEGDQYTVIGAAGEKRHEWEADLVVHGAGRSPALDMDLEKGKVESDKNGVRVNEYLQSVSNSRVYAAGDVAATDGPPLTPIATTESHIVAANLLRGNEKKAQYPAIASVVFTTPKLASVGMTEQQAKECGREVDIRFEEVSDWFTYRRTNERHAAFKVITDSQKGVVLGAHLLSGEAHELINHFVTAIRFELPIKELKKMAFAYPTVASDISYMI